MIAFNHALTGSLVGLTVSNPVIAVAAALASHFVCDALPHYGSHETSQKHLNSRRFSVQLISDMILCIALVGVLFIVSPGPWLLAAFCAFTATSPDFAWLPGYVRARRGQPFELENRNRLVNFAARIQWFERPSGAYVELFYGLGAITLLVAYLSAI